MGNSHRVTSQINVLSIKQSKIQFTAYFDYACEYGLFVKNVF